MKFVLCGGSQAKSSLGHYRQTSYYFGLCLDLRKVFLDRIFFESHFSFFQLFFRLLTYTARAIFLPSPENAIFQMVDLTKSFFVEKVFQVPMDYGPVFCGEQNCQRRDSVILKAYPWKIKLKIPRCPASQTKSQDISKTARDEDLKPW